jgi:hypothetical protein
MTQLTKGHGMTYKTEAKKQLKQLEADFEVFVAHDIERMRRERKDGTIGPYDGNRWFPMVANLGAVQACKRVLARAATAYQADEHGPCVEKWVLDKKWSDLFDGIDKAIARKRLLLD